MWPSKEKREERGAGRRSMAAAALGPDQQEEWRRRQQEQQRLRPGDMDEEEGQSEEALQLNLGELDLTSDEFILDEVDIHIQANLEDALVQEALKTGVDLRQYSKQVEVELQQIENASIKDYIKESKNIASLHTQITACDAVLQRMEAMLSSFQSDLSSISCEIQTLQEQSVAMNVRLRNRQAVRGRLSQLVEELDVPEAMISTILETPVTEQAFLEQLHELNNKITAVKEQAFRETMACSDVTDVLDKLKAKAVAKIRDFILQKIYSFRKAMTNYQIPQNALLKHRFFYQFLLGHERAVAKEVRDDYVDTMSKVFLSYFKSYTSRLMKVQYPFESLFRSQHFALLDNSCREYLFLCDFFLVSGTPALDLFNAVMGKTLTMFFKHMDSYVSDCYDSIAVFLCIHIVLRFRAIMAKRNIPAIDKYWDTLLEMLWPRFEHILELNIQSIQNTDPQKLGFLDTRPHYITRRYAEFSSAIVSINQTFPHDRTLALLGQLQTEVENFVLRVAAEFSSRKEQLIFLINNYDMMLGVLMERAVEESKEVEGFQQLLSARTQEFIEELLAPGFGGMIAFVKEAETLAERGQLERLRGEEARVTQLVRGFAGTWKTAVESLSQDVMRSFTNFKNGTTIIQGALTQLIQYYHRFHKVLALAPLKALPVRSELINIHHLMVEVKKHKPNF
ncbi:vacuolar protein sorting-associated protein 52 homolog isoform X4 [Rhineura floridana]|uniref:vacuolar protein sorting-associated protein 52 homolog isoform X4 n=1 Tax=Rhineura floridana TaxID=261503 RepID=UPI002AC7FAAD|nr:vacuolar protein sorting-associated protein 52 homolog isoform X4 [Rhineura floridana]